MRGMEEEEGRDGDEEKLIAVEEVIKLTILSFSIFYLSIISLLCHLPFSLP